MRITRANQSQKATVSATSIRTSKSETEVSNDAPKDSVSFGKGAEVVAGIASSVILAPRTLTAPLIAPRVDGKTGVYALNEEGPRLVKYGAGAGAALATGAAILSGGSPQKRVALAFAGLIGGAVVSFASAALTQEFTGTTVFDYKGILEARKEASESHNGDQHEKAGAAFSAGFKQAAKEGYEAGPRVLKAVTDSFNRKGSLQGLLDRPVGFVKGMMG